MFSKIDTNRIAEAVDIVDLVSTEVKLKPQGKTLVGCCPFHTEKTGSFTVSQARQTYHCFGFYDYNGISREVIIKYMKLGAEFAKKGES